METVKVNENLEIFTDAFGAAVMYKGNQIGYGDLGLTVELTVTDEDFENGEFSPDEIADVQANLPAIRAALVPHFRAII